MTAKPVRDLLNSKIRNQPKLQFRIDSIRQVEIEQVSKSNDVKTDKPIDMKELTVLNERSMARTDSETRQDRLTVDENESLTITTRQPISEKRNEVDLTNTTR